MAKRWNKLERENRALVGYLFMQVTKLQDGLPHTIMHSLESDRAEYPEESIAVITGEEDIDWICALDDSIEQLLRIGEAIYN